VSADLRYANAKARAKARKGERAHPQQWNTAGWRTEYPEEFPVIIRTIGDQPMIPRQSGHRHRRRSR